MRKTKWISAVGCLGLALTLMSQSILTVSAAEIKSDPSSLAGISTVFDDYIDSNDASEDDVRDLVLSTGTATDVSVTHDLAISRVDDYVNVRSGPSTDSEIVGKIYDQCGATILGKVNGAEGEWYYIQSGNVTGYIMSYFCVTGEEAENYALNNGNLYMKINEYGINVRSEANTDCDVVTVLYEGDVCSVTGDAGDFVQVELEDGSEGYVSKEFVDVFIDCDTAMTLEEEEAMLAEAARLEEEARLAAEAAYEAYLEEQRLAEEEAYQAYLEEQAALERAAAAQAAADAAAAAQAQREAEEAAARAAAAQAAADAAAAAAASDTSSSDTGSSDSGSSDGGSVSYSYSSGRQAIVDYAWSHVGCAYSWGAEGPYSFDCSGLVKCAYAQAGVGLYHQSGAQANAGTHVSISNAQPGDILWKSGHVGIYVGNGQCIHASDYSTGVIVSDVWSCGWAFAVNVMG